VTIIRYHIIDEKGNKRGYCDDTTKPFWCRGRYLPPLEEPQEKSSEPFIPPLAKEWKEIQQLKGQVTWLTNKLNSYLDKKIKVQRYTKYDT